MAQSYLSVKTLAIPFGYLLDGNDVLQWGMNKYEQRRQALIVLRQRLEPGAVGKIAEAIGKDASYISRMLSNPDKSGHKRITEDFVDLLDVAFPGWLLSGEGPMRDAAISPGSHGLPQPLDEPKPPTISDEVWQSLPPKARALVEDIVSKSHEGKIKEEDLVLLLSTADRLSQSDP